MVIMGGIIIHNGKKKVKLLYISNKLSGGKLNSNYTLNYLSQ